MHFLQKLPRILLKHKVIQFLCAIGLLPNPIRATYNGKANAFLNLSDPEPRNVFLKGVFEPDFFSVAQAMLPRNGTFFDIGANIGLCSFGLAPTHTETNYHLFEANPKLITLLENSAEIHSGTDFQINHNCVTNQPGKTRFCLEEEQSGQSHVATKEESGVVVPNLLLDEYVEMQAIERIDFAKMDLEGHELNALQGWTHNINSGSVEALYLEVVPENQKRYGLSTNAALVLLEECGYNLYLCKKQDFGLFGESPNRLACPSGYISTVRFAAEEYPNDFASDVLAIAPA
jgi:FkbM family methyltransferase